MNINATLINYLHLCHRKLWLHAHAIRMEHTSDIVAEGKLLGETSYPQRADKNQELEISAEVFTEKGFVTCTAKIDFFDAIRGIVYETKKSAAKELAHVAQVQFYLYLLRKNNVTAHYGQIEYPKLRQTERVELNDEDEKKIESSILKATEIISLESCPPTLPKSKCSKCSYFDFCWSGEE
jgi:CRISPR-associated exonuclease Cas4